ncbi:MAG: hypothetical protein ABDH28_01870 [Brevinematia bacterium]
MESQFDFLKALRLEPADFVIVGGNVDISKDGLLKILNTIPSYNLDTEVVRYDSNIVIVKCKIVVRANGEERTGTGHGSCSKEEMANRESHRIGHDILAIAETRAIKRAIEHALGTVIVNSEVRRLISEGKLQAKNWRQEIPNNPAPKLDAPKDTPEMKPEMKQGNKVNGESDIDIAKKIEWFNSKNAQILKEFINLEELKVGNWDEWIRILVNAVNKKAQEWGLEDDIEDIKRYYKVDSLSKLKPSQLIEVARNIEKARHGEYLSE